MKAIRRKLAIWLFDVATALYPGKGYGEAHHVGDKWIDWRIGK